MDDVLAQMKIFDEAIQHLSAKQAELVQAATAIAAASAPAPKSDGKESKKALLKEADDHFARKDWKKAIAVYNKYRESNPKGSDFAKSTYQIGVCFQELGMKSEARAFFDELIEKFPKDSLAKKASFRINQLKK